MILVYLIYLVLFASAVGLVFVKKTKCIYFLPIYFILFEILINIFIEYRIEEGFIGFQNLIIFLFIARSLPSLFNKPNLNLILLVTILLLGYYFFRIPFSEDPISLIVRATGLFNVFMLIPIGYSLYLDQNSLKKLNISVIRMLSLYCAYITIASILKFGPNHYGTDIIYGLRYEQYYSGALAVVMFPALYLTTSNRGRKFLKILGIITMIIIFLTLRRTAYIILLLGFLSFPLFFRYRMYWLKSNLKVLLFLFALFISISAYPGLTKYREYEFNSYYDFTDEGRYIEFNLAIDTLKYENNFLYGSGNFLEDRGKYGFKNPDRPIHSAFTKLFFGGGIIGLSLYFIVFILIFIKLKRMRINNDLVTETLKALAFTLIIIYFAVALTGGIAVGSGVSYTGTLFLYLGIILNILEKSNGKKYRDHYATTR